MGDDQKIRVIEFRNYLLRPGMFGRFRDLFDREFVHPMSELGGFTLGQYKIENDADRFVWIRGFEDMDTRLRFLNDFYLESDVWSTFKNEANSMIVNSDNVHLLRPLAEGGHLDHTTFVPRSVLRKRNDVLLADFYVCNGRLEQTIELFEQRPFLNDHDVFDTTSWVGEMSENKFTRLPAFQDKNLLVMMTTFPSRSEYASRIKAIDEPEASLKYTMLEYITTRHRLVLFPAINTI
jgi:hypothetical protein